MPNYKYTSDKVSKLKMNYRNKDTYKYDFNRKKGYKYRTVQSVVNVFSKNLMINGIGGEIYLSAKNAEDKWRSTKSIDIGDKIGNLSWCYTDVPDRIKNFNIFVLVNKNEGGTTDKNDCLFNCLAELLSDANPFKQPEELKKHLKIKRNEKVKIEDIEKIEDKIQKNLIVDGDIKYINNKYEEDVHVTLTNEHFKVRGALKTEKQPLIYQKRKTDVLVYDGKTEHPISYDEFNDMMSKPYTAKFILIKIPDKKKSLKENHVDLININDKLKQITNNKINLFRTGSYSRTALQMFFSELPKIDVDTIDGTEAKYLEDTTLGHIDYTDKENKDKAKYQYDINSFYSSLLRSNKFNFPIKKGEYLTLTKDEFQNMPYYKYGSYRIKILDPIIDQYHILWHSERLTHYDLITLKSLNVKFEIIEEPNNFLFYSKDKLANGYHLFRPFIDFLYPLKKESQAIKLIMNSLWGGLVQSKRHRWRVREVETEVTFKDGDEITGFYDNVIKYVNMKDMYVYPFARLKCFLLSYARSKIIEITKDHLKNIVEIKCDGFKSIHKIKELEISDEIGKFKFNKLK